MRVSVYYLFILVTVLFFNCFGSDPKIVLQDRVILGTNGVSTYLDYLKIENYKDGSFTAKQLSQIANQYVDTANTDKIIKGVIFLEQKVLHKLPKDVFNASTDEINKLSVLGFTFMEDEDNAKLKNASHNMKLKTITIFKEGNHQTFYMTNIKGKKVIDSTLASTLPYNNF